MKIDGKIIEVEKTSRGVISKWQKSISSLSLLSKEGSSGSLILPKSLQIFSNLVNLLYSLILSTFL
jgi:hypothetical protein